MRGGAAIVAAIVVAAAHGASALEPPGELLALKMQTRLLTETEGTITGEGVCWHAAWRAGDFVRGAREAGDAAYIEAGIEYFDALIDKLHTSPDGWRGWVGPYIYDESVIGDVHVGDAILVRAMLELAEYVGTEMPEDARQRFAVKAGEYIELAEHICAKWAARGTWRDFGRYGGYVSWDRFLTADRMNELQVREVRNAGLSLPFNKQQSMGIVHLRLYRLTGDAEHRRKAQLIYQYAKYRLSAFEDGFTWAYWEPFSTDDVASIDPPELAHWVNTHPYRNYQQGEVGEFVEAYHSGLVFTRADMERLVRTNLRMWNGDVDDPDWANSDDPAKRAAVPGWEPPEPAHGYTRLAGTLWRALAPFDPTLAGLAGVEADNTDYMRRYDLPVTEVDWQAPQVTFLQLGCALPPAVARGDTVLLVSKARAPGPLRITLTDADGDRELRELWSGATTGGLDGLEGVVLRSWTADVEPGAYRVRWRYGADDRREHRDDPLTVR